ncbi:MAG: L,D-transpeptidase family protein [Rhodospirillales bacterium]|nr:L,D-transpeptidase family protein [Rhodospirillales bacterium]
MALASLLAMALCWPQLVAGDEVQRAAGDRLSQALDAYRAIEARGGWPTVGDGPTLEEGMADARVPALRRRLAASGDLSPEAGREAYDGELAQAVRRFQARHGLAVDGRVGRETLASLNVSAAARTWQLERNLAGWQALPELGAAYVQVNVAAMLLDAVDGGEVKLRMPVVVGDVRHPTPVFSSRLTGVVFNPDWTVPPSIVRKEILPRLRRESGYLAASAIRLLDRPQDPFGATIDWRSYGGGAPRLRQDPGPRNALGLVKFDLPNPHDVYLHDTPSKRLFALPRRAFSHGCIRVSRPRELAAWALAVDDAAVEQAIAAGTTTRMPVQREIQVHVLYMTAFVDPGGTVQFRDDLYGLDAKPPVAPAPDDLGCGKQ